MSCNGCRVLRKGCSESCILRPCIQWIESPESQGHATVFVAKFFGRAGLMSFISSVPQTQRPALFQSLLYEAAGRTVNPVNGAVGLLWTGNWNICQAAVDTVLGGGTLKPMTELSGGGTQPPPQEMSENSVACNTEQKFLPRVTNSRSNKFSLTKRKRFCSEDYGDDNNTTAMMRMHAGDLDLRLTPNFPARGGEIKRPGTPSMNSEDSVTTTCFESGIVGDHYQSEEPKLLNLFI